MRSGSTTVIGEALFYRIAGDALEQGKSAENDAERTEALAVCFVFSALALEAFINRQLDASVLGDFIPGYDRLSLEDKWLACPLAYGASSTFERGNMPFQAFAELVRLRNQRLVHFKPSQEVVVEGAAVKRPPFWEVVGDVNLAERCFAAVKQMIVRLHELTGEATEIPRFLDGARYIARVSASVTVGAEHVRGTGGEKG